MDAKATRNLQLGYGLSILILLISSFASYFSIQNLLTSSRLVNTTNQVILELENTISILKDAETGQRGYLLTGNEEYLEPYNGAYDRALESIERIKKRAVSNLSQQKSIQELETIVSNRFKRLDKVINIRKTNKSISVQEMYEGKALMDRARQLVKKMETAELKLLDSRTSRMNEFAIYTPILIVIASLLSLVITIVSYIRAKKDIDQRTVLYNELQEKDKIIEERLAIIQGVAERVSNGNYDTKIENESDKDILGSLAMSLNKMAESLSLSFKALSEKEWLQTGIARLNEAMVGEKTIEDLTSDVLKNVVNYTNSHVAAFYVFNGRDKLSLVSGYALEKRNESMITLGQGIVGQAALDRKEIILSDISENITVSYAAGQAKPGNIIALPIMSGNSINGVIEIASFQKFTDLQIEYLKSISHNVSIAVNTAENLYKLQHLLEETQSQTEELQSQHSELEGLNTELEAQAQKLQSSEEELRVQQEELLETNTALEERSRALEEKNQLIVERNLDIHKKAEELELSTRYKSEFLANMSHELRTPLNSILLLSRLMADNVEENLSEDQIEYARVIQSSGNGLLSLIDEILDLSKIEAGKMDLEYADVSVKNMMSDLKSMFAPIAKERNLEFKIDLEEDVPLKISTDKMRVEQILKNLISNALKFTSKGSVSLTISNSSKPGIINISVKDTGIGIPKDKQLHIFEAFQQADGSTKRKFGGTGLGLSISRELAKLLGGEITLDSIEGAGSEFALQLPIFKPTVDEQIVEFKETVPVKQEIPVISSRSKLTVEYIPQEISDDRDSILKNDKVILIVEDDTNFAKALLTYTRKAGYKGLVAVRGDLGIEMATAYNPIAILLDIQLPVKDGWEVMEELKSNVSTRHIPVHIMSSLEVKKESLIKGAVDFINKPVALEQMKFMFQKLEEALNKSPKKVLIIEENPQHAKALAYFLETFSVTAEIKGSVKDGVNALKKNETDCVILDMGIPDQNAYETLDQIKKNPGLENLPIIIFTGKSLSQAEENRLKYYADSIVMKTAHSYQRILDEVALFLHIVEEKGTPGAEVRTNQKYLVLNEVLHNKTVLIADDDVRNIFSLTKALERLKMKVISATDGKEALKALEENPQTDIVLMDMMMPEMDGYESTSIIRNNPKFKKLPILAVTAKAMVGDRDKCIEAGASDYISKPVDIDQLISLLRVWLYDKNA